MKYERHERLFYIHSIIGLHHFDNQYRRSKEFTIGGQPGDLEGRTEVPNRVQRSSPGGSLGVKLPEAGDKCACGLFSNT